MRTFSVSVENAGSRLDWWLSQQCPDQSRSRIQQCIRDGHVNINGQPVTKPRHLLQADDTVDFAPPEPVAVTLSPEPIPLNILHEDTEIIVLNKPPDLVVHPAAGHEGGTLVNALLHHCTDLAGIGGELRPGIVHRLDKDTSGVIVVAKTEGAMQHLSRQFKDRTVKKRYIALVKGRIAPPTGEIETLIGRHPQNRKKMSVNVKHGRAALTRYQLTEAYGKVACLLTIHIATGRTHQIRVHMAHLGHPVLGDQEYGRARALPDGTPVTRQMLHAESLTLEHPASGDTLEFTAPWPDDFRTLVQHLRAQQLET